MGQDIFSIKKEIEKAGYCAVIEVTNGLSKNQLEKKLEQTKDAKEHVSFYINTPVDAGIVFYNNPKAKQYHGHDLDFLCQFDHFERDLAKEALKQAEREEDGTMLKRINIAHEEGMSLNQLFYPTNRHFQKYLHLTGSSKTQPRTMEKYLRRIANIKGVTLEIYTAFYLLSLLPDARIARRLKYSENDRQRRDIDIIIYGDKDDIRKELSDKFNFKQH